MKKYCIVIIGPTAVGKTSLAIQAAQHFSTEIISSDSRQCFRELNIGVARPSAEELEMVKHHFISSHSIHEEMNAVLFEEYALQKLADIYKEHDVAVMVGGTGLYVKAFCEGIDEVPAIDMAVRKEIISAYQKNRIDWLQSEIQKKDPLFFQNGEIQNPQRLMRALEVKMSTGRSILEFQTRKKKKRDFNIIKIGLELNREELVKRINNRVEIMMHSGLLDEVKALINYQNLNALQTVGYRELFDHLAGKITLDEAVEKIKINTRQYAKRQMTWFKKDKEINWCPPDFSKVLMKINELL